MLTEQKIKEVKDLHNKYAITGPFSEAFTDLIWTHSLIIADIAELIAHHLIESYRISIDLDILITGALLHDIGAYQTYDVSLKPIKDYVEHGVVGYQILIKEGYDKKNSSFCTMPYWGRDYKRKY